jgi:hypothetical membrane protein
MRKPPKKGKLIKRSAKSFLIILILALIILILLFLAIRLNPEFNWTRNALSDLGADQSSTKALFNSALYLGGVDIILLSLTLYRERSYLFVTMLFLIISGFSLTGIAFWNIGHPYHLSLAFVFFSALILSLCSLGGEEYFKHKSQRKNIVIYPFLGLLCALIWCLPWSSIAIPEVATLAVFICGLSILLHSSD